MDIEKYFEDRRTQFWALQLLGWTGWGVTFYVAATRLGVAPPDYVRTYPSLASTGWRLPLACGPFTRPPGSGLSASNIHRHRDFLCRRRRLEDEPLLHLPQYVRASEKEERVM